MYAGNTATTMWRRSSPSVRWPPRGAIRDVGRALNFTLCRDGRRGEARTRATLHMTLDEALKRLTAAARDVRGRRARANADRYGAAPSRACRATHRRTRRASSLRGCRSTTMCRSRRTTTRSSPQYTMTTLEELGLLKMDFLGLRNLTVIDDAVRDDRKTDAGLFDGATCTDDDPKVYRHARRRGKTVGRVPAGIGGHDGRLCGTEAAVH